MAVSVVGWIYLDVPSLFYVAERKMRVSCRLTFPKNPYPQLIYHDDAGWETIIPRIPEHDLVPVSRC